MARFLMKRLVPWLLGLALMSAGGVWLLDLGARTFDGPVPAATAVDTAQVDGRLRHVTLDGGRAARVMEEGRLLGVARGHDAALVAARFSDGGARLVTLDADGVRRVTDVADLSWLPTVERERAEWLRAPVWEPYGRPLHQTVSVWTGPPLAWVSAQWSAIVAAVAPAPPAAEGLAASEG